jgi:Bacterial Ig-like domain
MPTPGEILSLSRLLRAALAALSLAAVLGLPTTVHAADPLKVAIIVGPVGSLTPTYLGLAELAAVRAERHGATVARAYSPNATPANVLAAVANANVVIYFGHGYGHPSPYGGLNTATQNGWALQGPGAPGTHSDAAGQIAYYGEDWIVANARPAPGFVMIYSNTCYAPGASEGVSGHAPATALQAAQRVAYYSRSTFTLGGSAYFATDFDRGAADLVDRLVGNPGATFAHAFVTDARYVPSGLTVQGHHFSAGQQVWLHRSKYTDGPPNYWYAFAGNPELTPARARDPIAPTVTLGAPAVGVAPQSALTVRASEPLVGVSDATLRLTDGAGTIVPAAVSYDAEAGAVRIQPAQPMRLSERYQLDVANGITDEAGNALAPLALTVRTRLDADPLVEAPPIVLERGTHHLLRFDESGTLAQMQDLEVTDARWLTAVNRARLEGRPGTWLELSGGGLDAWWVQESTDAHAIGVVEEAALDPGTSVTLRGQRYTVSAWRDGAFEPFTELSVPEERSIEVDRRLVLDGRTHVRLGPAEGGLAGSWVAVGPGAVPSELSVNRLLGTEMHGSMTSLSLSLGDWPLFRFDARGRVTEQRTVSGSAAVGLATTQTLLVGGERFFVISGGELHGWAVMDGPRLTVVHTQAAPPAPG